MWYAKVGLKEPQSEDEQALLDLALSLAAEAAANSSAAPLGTADSSRPREWPLHFGGK
jgi:hypothetical protein